MKIIRTKEIDEEIENIDGEEFGETIYGTLVVDRFIDAGRYKGKGCMFKVFPDLSASGNADPRSHIFSMLSYKFEPSPECPRSWKFFTVSGKCEPGETMAAVIKGEDGKIINGRVKVELR